MSGRKLRSKRMMSYLTKSSSASAPAPKLPAELWLLIFEFVTDPSIDPAGYCNHLNFPHIDLHLRFPCDFPAVISPSRRDLRLVCRYFNALLQPSQSLYMNDPSTEIPTTTRELYILPQKTPQACLRRLLASPSISTRIAVLSLLCYEYHTQTPATAFDIIYDKSHSLAAVRALALCFHLPDYSPSFWSRLNDAFPNLTCLVLRGWLKSSYADAIVKLENLEVLVWDVPDPLSSSKFPRLRHLSCSFPWGPGLFATSPYLESLLLPNLAPGARYEWSLFPKLRLLGLPAQRMDAFPPLPPGHPLQHLYVFASTRKEDDHNHNPHLFSYEEELKWLKEAIERMPTITRLSLWFDKRPQNHLNWMHPRHLNWISGYFREEDLQLLGFYQREPTTRDCENGHHVVFERVKVESLPEGEAITGGERVSHHQGFLFGWNELVQSALRRLHF